ncbi:MAG: hypothetical protein WC501_05380 [Candidatus Micrarchaeia archaeon]
MAIDVNSIPTPRIDTQIQNIPLSAKTTNFDSINSAGSCFLHGEFTKADRSKLVDAIAYYQNASEGSKEKIEAIEMVFPLLIKGYKFLKQHNAASQKHEKILKKMGSLILEIAGNLISCCNSSDPFLSSKAFSALKNLPIKTAFKLSRICSVAKECRVPSIRLEAARFLLDEKSKSYLNPHNNKIVFHGKQVSLLDYINYLLKDGVENGNYRDVRDKFLEDFFKTAKLTGDVGCLKHFSSSKFPDTQQTAKLFLERIRGDNVGNPAVNERKHPAGALSGMPKTTGFNFEKAPPLNPGGNIANTQKTGFQKRQEQCLPTFEKFIILPKTKSYGTQAGTGF